MLPIFNSDSKDLSLMQTKWASLLNVLLNNPMSKGVFLKDVDLINGATIVNHRLSRKPQGWQIIDINGAARIYRSQPFNDLTLTLTSDASVTVSLYVF